MAVKKSDTTDVIGDACCIPNDHCDEDGTLPAKSKAGVGYLPVECLSVDTGSVMDTSAASASCDGVYLASFNGDIAT